MTKSCFKRLFWVSSVFDIIYCQFTVIHQKIPQPIKENHASQKTIARVRPSFHLRGPITVTTASSKRVIPDHGWPEGNLFSVPQMNLQAGVLLLTGGVYWKSTTPIIKRLIYHLINVVHFGCCSLTLFLTITTFSLRSL